MVYVCGRSSTAVNSNDPITLVLPCIVGNVVCHLDSNIGRALVNSEVERHNGIVVVMEECLASPTRWLTRNCGVTKHPHFVYR